MSQDESKLGKILGALKDDFADGRIVEDCPDVVEEYRDLDTRRVM